MQLSADLRHILDEMMASYSTAELSSAATAVSERYRRAEGGLDIMSGEEALAYLAVRFPATFCAAAKALEHLAAALPGFSPERILDLGAGPGTVTLAALARWPGIRRAALIEPNRHLRVAGESLLRAHHPGLDAGWHSLPEDAEEKYDLVVSGYVLNEIAGQTGAGGVREAVMKMWRAAGNALLIVEPGTPAGQAIVLQARDILLAEGAFIAAPCPHALACPLAGTKKWCHFSVRVERSRTHRAVKQDAVLPYEDEKFSYIAVSRNAAAIPRARVIGHPRGTKVVDANLCTAAGEYTPVKVPKSGADYKTFRKASWGDRIL